VRKDVRPVCIGQKQVWFLLRLLTDESRVRLDRSERPEFDLWRWVDFWYPLDHVVSFKRGVYERALRHLAPAARRLSPIPAPPERLAWDARAAIHGRGRAAGSRR
jgi:putative (di)nucleoside polyphosphate hydrolase